MSKSKKITILKQCKPIEKNSAIVILDVFRATSMIYYLFNEGVKKIYPMNNIDEAFRLKHKIKNAILVGESKGVKPVDFDYNNSPTDIINKNISSNVIMSTTSGTKAIKYYRGHNVYIGSLLNAKYLSDYLNRKGYKKIYLLPTNNKDKKIYNEDYLCAKYIYCLIKNKNYNIKHKLDKIKKNKNLRFFKMDLQHRFPLIDFYLCTRLNKFNFIVIYKDEYIERLKI